MTASYNDWIQAQYAAPYTEMNHDEAYAKGLRNIHPGNRAARSGAFARWCNEDAQLRFRVAHVLQQIVVCGRTGGRGQLDAMLWWNRVAALAFSNYRDILRLSATHRHMGIFLDNLANNAAGGRAPSQNYARELLQLFSMGVDKLNPDGSVMRDSSGNPVPTYTQEDIDALARLLCGWNLPFANTAAGLDGTPRDGSMMIQPSLAYNGDAVTFLGTRFERVASPTAADVTSRLDRCLNLIMAQPTTAVYISKQFICKMVTDSPSAAYISRVVSAFENNGSGVRGDLKAVVRAVLLDPEARGDSKPLTFGRTQEWVLSLTKAMRYGEMEPLTDAYSTRPDFAYAWATALGGFPPLDVLGEHGQIPMTPESVFNDYPFEYKVSDVDAPAAAMWGSTQILANVGRTMALSGQLGNALPSLDRDPTGRWRLTALSAQYDAAFARAEGTPAQKQTAAVSAMVDLVFGDLNQGRTMPPRTRSELVAFIDVDCATLPTKEKLAWLINIVRCLPETAVVI